MGNGKSLSKLGSDFFVLESLGELGVLSFLKIITNYPCVCAYFFVPLCAKFVYKTKYRKL